MRVDLKLRGAAVVLALVVLNPAAALSKDQGGASGPKENATSSSLDGPWDVQMVCPSGASVHEAETVLTNGAYARDFGDPSTGGHTELYMARVSSHVIHVSGRITFHASGVQVFDGTARGDGDLFAGIGQFAASPDCALTVRRR